MDMRQFFNNFFVIKVDEKSYFKVNRPEMQLEIFSSDGDVHKHTKMGLFAFRECEPAQRIMNASTFLPIFFYFIFLHSSFNLCTLHVSLNYTELNANVPGN